LGKGLNVQNYQLVHPEVQQVFPDLVRWGDRFLCVCRSK
jgi:hypothetical protein